MIASEGLVPIATASVVAVAVAYFASIPWSLPLWGLCAYLVYLFHDVDRVIPHLPLALLSPGDGRVMEIAQDRDPWLARDACRIRVHLAVPGIGMLRSPTEGKIMDYWTSVRPFNAPGPGAPVAAGPSPNCYAVWVQTDEGDDVVYAVSSIRPMSRFKLYFAPGERIGQGQRSGFIYFGTFVDVLVPSSTKLDVSEGDVVEGGCTVLAHLVRD